MLDDILRNSDFSFWSRGKHQITPTDFFTQWVQGEAILLDLRSPEEAEFISLPFALHIPLHELPDRLDEIPRDKLVATLCPGGSRAAVGYIYLRGKGFDNVRILKGALGGLLEELSPGKIRGYLLQRRHHTS